VHDLDKSVSFASLLRTSTKVTEIQCKSHDLKLGFGYTVETIQINKAHLMKDAQIRCSDFSGYRGVLVLHYSGCRRKISRETSKASHE
jgi:hypothetical protein